MKKHWLICTLLSCCVLVSQSLIAQQSDCTPLFTGLANHRINSCESKEYESLEIYRTATPDDIAENKQGAYLKVEYAFEGNFENRPSRLQIYLNYEQALNKAGGEVLYNGNRGLFGKLKKNGDTWWIRVNTDGSGWYWYESIKETGMRQDVVLNATEMTQLLKEEGKITFYNIYFDTDQSAIKPASAPALQNIAAVLKANPSWVVFVVGHTDNTGTLEKNMSLSKERAAATVSDLVNNYQVNKVQLLPQGVGPLCPVDNNRTESGKARNRRVEIVLASQ